MSDEAEDDFDSIIRDITPYVMKSLEGKGFFVSLEELIFNKGADNPIGCKHDFTHATALLIKAGYTAEDREDIFAVMRSRGGFCDCEILYNALEESLPRERYWKTRAAELKQNKQ
ncbi:DUF2695 domain-containing protein [Granulicella mallensis]|jgi:hypothetical protein|uniref:DUF2695 domain-containing protein n=1 Tax=Granulicella mallensis TaxID=940614 RepID=A0A7W8EBX2_9BACT|nr:DUF2695 domain-containing protein [Granulicella mallensis]MBB5065045.1 hypothetical protein [Granulicella mallensis]